jgi:hypothetical protein
MKYLILISAMMIILAGSACKKEAGEGGTSSILGRVWVEEWDGSFTYHDSLNDRWGKELDVYIIFGNNVSYGDRVRTNYDGCFEFKYLREGEYTIYVYSKAAVAGGVQEVKKTVTISGSNQAVDAGKFTIID